MADLLIYVPGAEASADKVFPHVGLGEMLPSEHFPGPAPLACEVATGPSGDGVPGCVFGYCTSVKEYPSVKLAPDSQEWEQFQIDGKAVWLGREKGKQCSPAALRRASNEQRKRMDLPPIPTRLFSMDDGQQWELPRVQALPRRITWKDGEWTEEIRAPFVDHYAQGEKFIAEFEGMKTGMAGNLKVKDTIPFVMACLRMCYVITDPIAGFLGLFQEYDTIINAAAASVEWDYYLMWESQKKTGLPELAGHVA